MEEERVRVEFPANAALVEQLHREAEAVGVDPETGLSRILEWFANLSLEQQLRILKDDQPTFEGGEAGEQT